MFRLDKNNIKNVENFKKDLGFFISFILAHLNSENLFGAYESDISIKLKIISILADISLELEYLRRDTENNDLKEFCETEIGNIADIFLENLRDKSKPTKFRSSIARKFGFGMIIVRDEKRSERIVNSLIDMLNDPQESPEVTAKCAYALTNFAFRSNNKDLIFNALFKYLERKEIPLKYKIDCVKSLQQLGRFEGYRASIIDAIGLLMATEVKKNRAILTNKDFISVSQVLIGFYRSFDLSEQERNKIVSTLLDVFGYTRTMGFFRKPRRIKIPDSPRDRDFLERLLRIASQRISQGGFANPEGFGKILKLSRKLRSRRLK